MHVSSISSLSMAAGEYESELCQRRLRRNYHSEFFAATQINFNVRARIIVK